MTKNEIATLTERVPKSLAQIERETGMPPSTLTKAAAGVRPLPKKWRLIFRNYCVQNAIPVITEVRAPEPVRISAKKAELSPYLKSRQQSKLGKKP